MSTSQLVSQDHRLHSSYLILFKRAIILQCQPDPGIVQPIQRLIFKARRRKRPRFQTKQYKNRDHCRLYRRRITRRNMTHTLAMEWAKHNIRVNSVSPGLVQTAMTYWVPQQPDWEQQLQYYGGFPRLAEVQELGGAYVYLLSDAASYTTSIDIPVNGVIGSEFSLSVCCFLV